MRRVTFADPRGSDLRFRYELAEALGMTVEGIYDESGELVQPGIVHMVFKEYRHHKQLAMRRAEEASKQ